MDIPNPEIESTAQLRTHKLVASRVSRPVVLMVLVVASWASATVVSKHLYLAHLITPLTLVACRFTLAGVFSLLLFMVGYRQRRKNGTFALPKIGSWHSYLLGGGLLSVFIIGFNLALLYITATLGGLVFFGLVPIIMLVVGHFWLGSSFARRQLAGIAVALVGVLVVTTGGDIPHFLQTSLNDGGNLLLGLALMVLSAVGWGGYGLWGKRYTSTEPGGALFYTGINQLIGVVPVWLIYLWLEPNQLLNLQPEAWLFILYLGIVPSALGFALFILSSKI